MLLIGGIPPTALVIFHLYDFIPMTAICAFIGSLWGLTIGVLRRSLGSALLGLNTGAILGFGYGRIIEHRSPGFPEFFLILSMSLLGMAVYARRKTFFHSLIFGGLAGLMSGYVMVVFALIAKFFLIEFRGELGFIIILCVFPWTAGLTLFSWLLVDMFPWIEATSGNAGGSLK